MMPMAKVVAVKVNQVGINPAMGIPRASPYRKPVITGCFLKSITLIIPPFVRDAISYVMRISEEVRLS
jgi:hypothetical protein